jgi:hypothetical protein
MPTRTLNLTRAPERPNWQCVGVFPTDEDVERLGDEAAKLPSMAFVYTVSDGPFEVWCPSASIEGRYAGPQLTAMVVNMLRAALVADEVAPGDDVIIPLGVVIDGEVEDQDAVFWIGELTDDRNGQQYQCNLSPHSLVLPIRWSSPLGWPNTDG